jgi:hypothetical protein
MANKCVPQEIAGVALHQDAQERTHKLLQKLASRGAAGVADEKLSMIDRFRLLASAYFDLTDPVPADAPSADLPVSEDPNNT